VFRAESSATQEVDRLEKLLPVLDSAGFSHFFGAGPKKRHGCLIAFNKDIYTTLDEKVLQFDEQELKKDRRGCSMLTTNIAILVALKAKHGRGGAIVATTHLFWHPRLV
jgi:RNA exonuclease NGL2